MRLFAAPRHTTNNGEALLDGLCLDPLFPEASHATSTAPAPVPTPAPASAPMRLSLSSSVAQDDDAAPMPLPSPAPKRRPRFSLLSGFRRACAQVGGTMVGLAVAGASMVVGSRSPAAVAPKAEAETEAAAPMPAPSATGGLESAHREEEDEESAEEETKYASDACVEAFDLDPPAPPLTLAGRIAKAYGRLCWGLRATRKAFLEAAAALHMAAHVVMVMCFGYGGLCMTPPDVEWERDGELHS